MTQDEIMRMALEAGIRDSMEYPHMECDEQSLERFAALIEKHLSYDGIHTCHDQCQRPACVAIRKAVEREREACITLIENIAQSYHEPSWAFDLVKKIRARGQS
jgi:hypothetical protein